MIAIRLIKELTRWFIFNFYKATAIARWKYNGKRHWVLPVSGSWYRMTVLNNDQIAAYNKMATRKKYTKLDLPRLMKIALYGTPAGSTGERKRHG